MKFKRIYEIVSIYDYDTKDGSKRLITVSTNTYIMDSLPKDNVTNTVTLTKYNQYFDNQEEFLIEFKHFLRGVK